MNKCQKSDAMEYLLYLMGAIAAYEKELKCALIQRVKGNEGQITVRGKVIDEKELARITLVLFIGNPAPKKEVMERPQHFPNQVKKCIIKKESVCSLLEIPVERAPETVESWLRARS